MTNEESKASVIQNMTDMSARFPDVYAKYYNGVYRDTDLLEMTTQPFWQSMRLSKKRLDAKGLCMDLDLKDDFSQKNVRNSYVEVDSDGSNLVGLHHKNVISQRHFTKNGKKLRTKKEYEHLNIHMLQGKVEGEIAICPNCGHEGKIAGFIDGCDFCGSLFTVKDFETKVSGFSLEENTAVKLKHTMNKTAITLGIITGALMILGAICLGLVILLLMTGNNGLGAVGSVWGFMIAVDFVQVGFRCIWILLILYVALRIFLLNIYRSRIRGEQIVQNMIPDFSGEDFCQNLEYKLRNIHMTDNWMEVSAFATCPLERIVEKYRDVVDCNVTRCRFTGAYEQDERYVVKAMITMRLTLCTGRKIRTKYEKLMLTLDGRKNVINKKEMALREYKCEGCANSINILEGNTCRYCGAPIDYAKYGWVIREYCIEKKPANIHAIASGVLIAIYALVFVVHLIHANGDTENDNWLTVYKDFAQTESEVKAMYESVPMPEDVRDGVELTDTHYDIVSMTNTYRAQDAEKLAVEYLAYLLGDDFIFYEEKSGMNKYVFYREEVIEDEAGYLIVTVTATEDTITVAMDAASDLAEVQ